MEGWMEGPNLSRSAWARALEVWFFNFPDRCLHGAREVRAGKALFPPLPKWLLSERKPRSGMGLSLKVLSSCPLGWGWMDGEGWMERAGRAAGWRAGRGYGGLVEGYWRAQGRL